MEENARRGDTVERRSWGGVAKEGGVIMEREGDKRRDRGGDGHERN